MQASSAHKAVSPVPLVLGILLCGGLALLAESQLQLPLRLPGHRAFPGAMALVLLAGAAPRSVVVGFAAVVGVAIGLVSHNPALAMVWLVPATLLAGARPRTMAMRVIVAVGAGLAFGLLRYLALGGGIHHTPEAVRLTGHLVFGALGAVGVAHEAYLRRRTAGQR